MNKFGISNFQRQRGGKKETSKAYYPPEIKNKGEQPRLWENKFIRNNNSCEQQTHGIETETPRWDKIIARYTLFEETSLKANDRKSRKQRCGRRWISKVCSAKQCKHETGFLKLSITDMLGEMSFVVGGCPVNCGICATRHQWHYLP